jgi:hypothetical protein
MTAAVSSLSQTGRGFLEARSLALLDVFTAKLALADGLSYHRIKTELKHPAPD